MSKRAIKEREQSICESIPCADAELRVRNVDLLSLNSSRNGRLKSALTSRQPRTRLIQRPHSMPCHMHTLTHRFNPSRRRTAPIGVEIGNHRAAYTQHVCTATVSMPMGRSTALVFGQLQARPRPLHSELSEMCD